jgi:hypothetical protein
MIDFVRRQACLHMKHSSYGFIQSAGNSYLNRTYERHIGKTHLTTGGSWKGCIEINRTGEEN